jgi:hypothetical protein
VGQHEFEASGWVLLAEGMCMHVGKARYQVLTVSLHDMQRRQHFPLLARPNADDPFTFDENVLVTLERAVARINHRRTANQ